MTKTRTKGFSELIRRRFLIGSFSLLSENQEEVYLRAQRCRRLIVNAVNEILKQYDLIFLPATTSVAPKFSNSAEVMKEQSLISDNYLAFANMAGLPSLTLPLGMKDGLPFGVNITGRPFEEQTVFDFALAVEEMTGLKNLSVRNKK